MALRREVIEAKRSAAFAGLLQYWLGESIYNFHGNTAWTNEVDSREDFMALIDYTNVRRLIELAAVIEHQRIIATDAWRKEKRFPRYQGSGSGATPFTFNPMQR